MSGEWTSEEEVSLFQALRSRGFLEFEKKNRKYKYFVYLQGAQIRLKSLTKNPYKIKN